MEINISVKHKSKPKPFNNFYKHSIKQDNYIYMREREKDRETETETEKHRHRERDRNGEKCLGCVLQKSILDRSKNKDQSSN